MLSFLCLTLFISRPAETVLGMPVNGPSFAETQGFDEVIVKHMRERHLVGGATAVMLNGKLVYAKGYGYANQETKSLAKPTSLFRIASVSKPITAVAILKLLEGNPKDLTLDTPVYRYLGIRPFDGKDERVNKVTVRHLLHHLGGMDRDKAGDLMFRYRECVKEIGGHSLPLKSDFAAWAMGKPLQNDPETHYAYSNYGFWLLGRVIEKATGSTYEDYVNQKVLKPLGAKGMHIGKGHASLAYPGEVTYYAASGGKGLSWDDYYKDHSEPVAYAFNSPEFMDAHGGWIASPIDLVRFASRFPQLLTPASQQKMVAYPGVPMGKESEPVWYGAGWLVRKLNDSGAKNIWHNGGMPGTASILVRLANGYTWAIVFNRDDAGDIDGLMYRATSAVRQWPVEDLDRQYK